MKDIKKTIFLIFCSSLMVLIRARYLLVELGQEPHPSDVGLQAREPGNLCTIWRYIIFEFKFKTVNELINDIKIFLNA